MRRFFSILMLAFLPAFQGCSSTLSTFLAGTLVGTVIGINALSCTTLCH
jgi:hypothetical protein